MGDRVAVRYDPDRPSEARIDDWLSWWFLPSLLGGLGVLFAAVSVAGAATGLGALPLYDQDLDRESVEEPASVADLRRRISEADALLLVTPEHNGSVSAALKNAIDWVSARHRGSWLRGKTVAIAGATTGRYGAIWAQQDLRRILGLAGARVVGPELPVSQAQESFDETGACLDPRLAERVRGHLDLLVAEARGEGLPEDRLPMAA